MKSCVCLSKKFSKRRIWESKYNKAKPNHKFQFLDLEFYL